MSIARDVLPGRTYMITRRCTQRQFLMRPDRETNNAFIYCLAVAAQRSRIRLLFTVALSNHHHTGIEDPEGNYPEFLEHSCAAAGRSSGPPSKPESFAWSNPTTSSTR
jgi:putative transposase